MDWAVNAGKILKEGLGKEHQIHHKGVTDLVTEMDKLSEDYLLGESRSCFPEHSIITEESGYLDGDDGACWYGVCAAENDTVAIHGLDFDCALIHWIARSLSRIDR